MSATSNVTFNFRFHEMCVRLGGRAGVRYVITKFYRMDSLPNILTHAITVKAVYHYQGTWLDLKIEEKVPMNILFVNLV